jgi:hypothetical protein
MGVKNHSTHSSIEKLLASIMSMIMFDFPLGPKCIKICHVINLQKVGMPFFLALTANQLV